MSNKNKHDHRNIGFFPITSDPIHYGHLIAATTVLKLLDLDIVFIQICGQIAHHKPNKASYHHRHKMAKMAIAQCYPYIQYTPLGKNDNLVGEDVFIKFSDIYPPNENNKFYYIAGSDNENIVLERFNRNYKKIINRCKIILVSRNNRGVKIFSHNGKNFQQADVIYLNEEDVIQMNKNFRTELCVGGYSSSLFRERKRIDIVPKKILAYCKRYNLYGYKPGK